jgi:hypothetical protein
MRTTMPIRRFGALAPLARGSRFICAAAVLMLNASFPRAGAAAQARGTAVHGEHESGESLAKTSRAGAQKQAEITYTGFASRPDGGATVFVELSREVPVSKAQSGRTVTYTLANSKVVIRNNLHPLLTGEFGSVVTSVRLVPDKKAKATKLVIELRDAVEPSHRMRSGDGGAVLEVSFPAPKRTP